MSCESCTGCFEAAPCSSPSPSTNGHISKEYRHFLKAAKFCTAFQTDQTEEQATSDLETDMNMDRKKRKQQENLDHAFNTLIGILANNQFTAQTYLALAYRQLGPTEFLQLARSLAHHGFWGRLITWASFYVKEDSKQLQLLLDQHSSELSQHVNDEAEMFEVFNPAVNCQRVKWSIDPIPSL
ncbi:hypothetical protein BC939DRAFT_465665 [Gamsiella multidivaricata]|uniref:uncharacterized protein n=1 Tax=Gamsiella multidivaricata TaxID=101098 RepID=UPI0022202262|nr:uncharacterized protein BC939DRAFT_465665 [Gamsiella multidivaricata]KAG0370363.1 hypothetical protein BGZ54_006720 [Gamsiella multidivaricata]KAI7817539.1 hypothetical protein BC939DRAFT_465665 [Gamsiella multidivaricata]